MAAMKIKSIQNEYVIDKHSRTPDSDKSTLGQNSSF